VIRYHISLFIFVLIACVLQQFIPAVTALYDARILLLHLVFLCCAVTVGFSPMLGLAFLCGFLWDANNTLGPQGGDSEVYINQIDSLRFGYSILLFGLMGVLMQCIQPLFRRGAWQVSAILTGISVFLYLLAEFLLITFVRGEWIFPAKVLTQIWLTAAMTMLCSPLIFAILFKLAKLFDFTIRYDGLKRRYFTPEAYSLDK
jgi:cell shape-determining protein MreD